MIVFFGRSLVLCVFFYVFVLTWSKGFGPLWVQRLRPEGGTGLQLGFGELRQVGHHRVLVHVGVDYLFRSDHLWT